jgi:hypothetical protein
MRRVAIYLTSCHFGHSPKKIHDICGISRQHCYLICSKIEDQRDDPEFDGWLCGLESRLDLGNVGGANGV